MAQIIPPLTTLPSDSSAAPSVEDIQDRLPSICVDYLSHDWSEEDVWASWRNMTRHKHEIANGVRLENASWRTWQKQRNKLKTISPETLNWLKDSDVTWLYGPLHTAHVEVVPPLKTATADERLGIDVPMPRIAPGSVGGPKKPILKHRTLSEMLTIPMPTSPILESTNLDDDDDLDSLDGHPDRPVPQRTKSDSNIFRNRNRRKSPPRNANSASSTPANGQNSDLPPLSANASNKRHISFNTFVEQCVAIDEAEPSLSYAEEDSDDDMLEMKSSAAGSSRSSLSSMFAQEHLTIAKIAPTLLKVNGAYAAGATAPQMIYAPPPEYISPPLTHPGGFDFPTPAQQYQRQQEAQQAPVPHHWRQEAEDGYGSVGYEYFQGPDLATGENSSPSFASAMAYARPSPPNANLAPPVVKGRGAVTPPDTSLQSSSTSSTSSLGNLGSSPGNSHQPTRSILKVRPPGSVAPEEQVSPPAVDFNYNPSVATGIGGMRTVGGYEYPVTSPPSNEETRGRSAARGSSVLERSASRGTSASSSLSPGTGAGQTSRTAPIDARGRSSSSRNAQAPPSPAHSATSSASSASSFGATVPNVRAPIPKAAADDDRMDVDEAYHPEKSDTPTPHSSPQISFRPLKDASPASLPHTSSPPIPSSRSDQPKRSDGPDGVDSRPRNNLHSDLPTADPPARVNGSIATTAHVPTTAQPTMSLPTEEDSDELDGSSIMGRAANIASTAKDLLGALWYGANDPRQGRYVQPSTLERSGLGLPDSAKVVSRGAAQPLGGNVVGGESAMDWATRRVSR